jgi:hypothetical protein
VVCGVDAHFLEGAVPQPATMSLFATIQRSFESLRSVKGFDRAVRHWSRASGALVSFRDADELIEALECFRDRQKPPNPLADAALAELCLRARDCSGPVAEDPPTRFGEVVGRRRLADDAALLILWLFLPQLWGTSFANPGGALERDDLEAEMALGLWEAVAKVEDDDAEVGRRLVQAARNGARAAARRALDYQRRCSSLEAADHVSSQAVDELRFADPDHVVGTATRQEVVNELEARLILETRVDGRSLKNMSAALGMTEKGAEHRRARAERRLDAWLSNGSIPSRRQATARTRSSRALPSPNVAALGTATGCSSSGSGSREGGDGSQSPRSPSSIQRREELGIGCRGS